MTRVIAGEYGGRRLAVPKGVGTRPTADRAREGLFSTLQSLIDLDGTKVLDLYAGSGALGLEALSRGASRATLVDDDPRAVAVLTKNVAALEARADVVDMKVELFLEGQPSAYQLVLLDPPYEAEVDPVLQRLEDWTEAGSVVVVERRTRGPKPLAPAAFEPVRERRYGEATLWYFSRS